MNKSLMTYLMNFQSEIWVPVVCWYIRADDKNILVDSGAPPEMIRRSWYGEYEETMSFENGLDSVGVSPDRIDILIQTHLHFDHCGNTPKCENAEVIVQAAELEFARRPHPLFYGSYPASILPRIRFRAVSGDVEVASGIRVVQVPGHTPGAQAVSIETRKGRYILSGFCSIMDNFFPPEKMKNVWPVLTPGVHVDSLEAFESALRIKEMDGTVIPIHAMEYATKSQIP